MNRVTNHQLHTFTNGHGTNGHDANGHFRDFDNDFDYSAPLEAPDTEAIVRQLLQAIGEDPQREGLLRTPDRVVRMYRELTAGYDVDTEQLINGACLTWITVKWCW